MKKNHRTLEQKIELIKQIEANLKNGAVTAHECKRLNISTHSYYVWKEQIRDHNNKSRQHTQHGDKGPK